MQKHRFNLDDFARTGVECSLAKTTLFFSHMSWMRGNLNKHQLEPWAHSTLAELVTPDAG